MASSVLLDAVAAVLAPRIEESNWRATHQFDVMPEPPRETPELNRQTVHEDHCMCKSIDAKFHTPTSLDTSVLPFEEKRAKLGASYPQRFLPISFPVAFDTSTQPDSSTPGVAPVIQIDTVLGYNTDTAQNPFMHGTIWQANAYTTAKSEYDKFVQYQ